MFFIQQAIGEMYSKYESTINLLLGVILLVLAVLIVMGR